MEALMPGPRRAVATVLSAVAALTVGACSSSTAPTGGSSGRASTAPPTEVHPPGDIPDNQAFIAYTGAGYRVLVPEGWSRTRHGGAVEFSDKYNSITVSRSSASHAPTPATARTTEIPAIRASAAGFKAGSVSTVDRRAGTAVLIRYRALSPVNPVTGKVTQQSVERYEFWRAGQEVAITLAAPVGSDNVDPWRTVTDGFAWTRR
jgi:hypothetical protein